MNLKAKILATDKFQIEGKSYVKLQGFLQNVGVFQQTVREELVPDSLEGKECVMVFNVGLDNRMKPYLKLNGISLDLSDNSENI